MNLLLAIEIKLEKKVIQFLKRVNLMEQIKLTLCFNDHLKTSIWTADADYKITWRGVR